MPDIAQQLMRSAAPRVSYGPVAEAQLARIIGQPPPAQSGRNRYLLAVAAVLIVAFGIVVHGLQPLPAMALPPALEVKAVTGSVSKLLSQLAQLRRQQPNSNTIDEYSWALGTQVSIDAPIKQLNDQPLQRRTTFQTDGSCLVSITAGEPYPGQPDHGFLPPHTPLHSYVVPAQHSVVQQHAAPLPKDVSLVGHWFDAAYGPQTTGSRLLAIGAVLAGYPVTAAQEAAVLEYLAGLDGLMLAGEVTDRLRRTGLAFQASDRGPYTDTIIVDSKTGEVIAEETRTSQGVILYRAWRRTG